MTKQIVIGAIAGALSIALYNSLLAQTFSIRSTP